MESRWAGLTCALAAGLVLFALGSPPEYPAVYHDELCRLSWARFFSGTGPHFELASASYCQPTYPLLLVPLYWLGGEAGADFRLVFLVNSLLIGATLPLAVHLSLRHFTSNVAYAWLAGVGYLAYPTLTMTSHHAWAEPALYPAMLLAFCAWAAWVDRPDWSRFAWFAATCFFLYLLHRKMQVFPVVLAVAVLAGFFYDRSAGYRLRALGFLLSTAVLFLLVDTVKTLAMSAFWQRGDALIIERFLSPEPIEFAQTVLGRIAGQMVYAVLITGGLIWFSLVAGLRLAGQWLRPRRDTLDMLSAKAAFVPVAVALLALETALFHGSALRFDVWFYGRHIDPAVAAGLLPGIALALDRNRSWFGAVLAAAIAGVILLVLALTFPAPAWEDYSPVHVIGVRPVMDGLYVLDSRWLLLAACGLILLVSLLPVLLTGMGRLRMLAVIPFAALATAVHTQSGPWRGVDPKAAFPAPAPALLQDDPACAILWDRRIRGRERMHQFWRLQYHFQRCDIEFAELQSCEAPGRFIISQDQLLDCRATRDAYPLHPDLVLYAPRDETP